MRGLRFLVAGALAAGLFGAGLFGAGLVAAPAFAAEAPHPPKQKWTFTSVFGAFDLASAQRGFQVYSETCANCHSMRLLHYRDLTGIGLTPEQVKMVASAATVPQGLDDQGVPKEGPATAASRFRAPFPNDVAARAANNGAMPPDLSLIVNAREGEYDYIYAVLIGYAEPQPAFPLQDGMSYNTYFPGHQIGMPRPLSDGQVTYIDGTSNSTEQMARDVVTFLTWAANPEMVERKQMGVRIVLFLILMTGLTYMVKRRVWANVH